MWATSAISEYQTVALVAAATAVFFALLMLMVASRPLLTNRVRKMEFHLQAISKDVQAIYRMAERNLLVQLNATAVQPAAPLLAPLIEGNIDAPRSRSPRRNS